MGFWGFEKNAIHSYELILLEYESTNGLLIFSKNNMRGKDLLF